MVISVREIGLNWLQLSKVVSYGAVIRSALFQTAGTLPLLKEELNIFSIIVNVLFVVIHKTIMGSI